MANIFQGKNILVTGGTGSIGSEVVRQVLKHDPKVVRAFSNDEDGQFNLEQELKDCPNVRFLIGDVRDKERLKRAAEGIDFIFHAAALKHVPLCEYNPFEAVKTNVLGTQYVIEVAIENEVEKLITISTDKAVNPVSVMGATKLLAERLTISANYYKGPRRTAFSCVRFGNVLDSRGSVVPLFRKQIEKGGPVTITDAEMSRFIMTISRAAELVLKAAELARGGEIFVLKMPVLRIRDLAVVMIEELAPRYGYDPAQIEVKITGKRVGEKHHEELITEEESAQVYETEDMLVVQPPDLVTVNQAKGKRKSVSMSKQILSKDEIRIALKEAAKQK